ncbi:ubinuclein-1-like isoform X2 [Corylus avellana]|uniref:ubinuclein-1-like isoform X2 n=1 Tax=Corylus avellana TaxID=13451 RepID=UPI00286C753F|nr:ubinuclein-1-like isoform X2 [Corylus avellana]
MLMEEEKAVGVGGGESSRASSSFVKAGDRQMFTVELRPGETTIVSWKKLLKDANKVNGSASTSVPDPPADVRPVLESRLAPGQPTEDEVNDAPAPHRFSAVIEKIERLYMGKDSSDEEDLHDFPDDDQYDTEDSFIDDAELDEYFEVDNSAVKHDGFFVNRGKLERINKPTVLPNQQPKKRRRKDLEKGHGRNDDCHASTKHVKKDKMAAGRIAATLVKDSSSPSQNLDVTRENLQDVKFQNQLSAPGNSSKKKSADAKTIFDPSPSLKVSNGDASVSLEVRDIDMQKTGAIQSKNLGDKLKDVGGSFEISQQKHLDKSAYAQSKSLPGRPLNSVDQLELSIRPKEKNSIRELSENNFSVDKSAMQMTKATHIRKDGSSVRPRSSLEKAIRELEKMVAESRPPTVESQEADTSSQAVKRRLPREIKMKLAKVARLAASQGRISKELLSRLMSILGHLIQLRTLKRNLKVMISMGLSAKQEKDNRFQQIKKEVVEMIKIQAPSLELKAFGQQAGASDDFQELCSEEKGVKKKFSMDAALEDKICDLYDLFVDGLDEEAGPPVRKLYGELAELWPNGFMDNHGIKRAICKAKERRRALYNRHKEQEKITRKKMLAPKIEETVRVEGNSIAQPQSGRERLSTETGGHGLTPANRPVSNNTSAAVRMQSPSSNGPLNSDRIKQEKLKGTSSNSLDDARVSDGGMPKKKVKRKPEVELDETHFRPEKLASQQGEERYKPLKQAAGLPHKSNLPSTAPQVLNSQTDMI